MSATNGFETDLLEHIFQNAAIANVGDASGLPAAATAGSLYVALFTADPGEAGAQTNEADYTGYARVAVARSAAGWTVADNNVSNAAAVTFGECTAGTNTITHFAILTAATSGDMLFSGALTASLSVSKGITPEVAIGALDVNVD